MKKITIIVPDDTIAGTVTIVKMQDRLYGLELKTRNFDFQVKNGASLSFDDNEVHND